MFIVQQHLRQVALAITGAVLVHAPALAADDPFVPYAEWTLKTPTGLWTVVGGGNICDAHFTMTKPANLSFAWTRSKSGDVGVTFTNAADWPIDGTKTSLNWTFKTFPNAGTASAKLNMSRSSAGNKWSYFAFVPEQTIDVFAEASTLTVSTADGSQSAAIDFGDESAARVVQRMKQCAAAQTAKAP